MTQRWRLRWLRARKQFARFYNSIWFLPFVMAFGAVVLFILSSALEDSAIYDRLTPRGDFGRFLIFAGSPSAARSILSAIATGWATILGVVFSVTLVTVQLTASKYTAQMLTQFEKDKTNQLVLGAYVGTVTYALLVLKTVRTGEDGGTVFIPIIGTNLAIAFAVVDLLLLVLFVSNLVSFVRPQHFIDSTVETIVNSLDAVIAPHQRGWLEPLPSNDPRERERAGQRPRHSDRRDDGAEHWRRDEVMATADGVVSGFSWDDLLDALRGQMIRWRRSTHASPAERDAPWYLRLTRRLGDRVADGEALAVIEAPVSRRELEQMGSWVKEAYQVVDERRPEGDPEYGIIMLGAMGVKAGTDADLEVAVDSIDAIFTILGKVIALPEPSPRLRVHADGSSLLIERPTTDLFGAATQAVAQVTDAALRENLSPVLQMMSRRATDVMIQATHKGTPGSALRLLRVLTPLYQRALSSLEDQRALRSLVEDLGDLAGTFAREYRDDEARLVVDALAELRQGQQQRPETARMLDECLRQLLQSPAIVERPEVWAALDRARSRAAG